MRTDAKHLSAPPGKKVQMSAETFRSAPIRTYPVLSRSTGPPVFLTEPACATVQA